MYENTKPIVVNDEYLTDVFNYIVKGLFNKEDLKDYLQDLAINSFRLGAHEGFKDGYQKGFDAGQD